MTRVGAWRVFRCPRFVRMSPKRERIVDSLIRSWVSMVFTAEIADVELWFRTPGKSTGKVRNGSRAQEGWAGKLELISMLTGGRHISARLCAARRWLRGSNLSRAAAPHDGDDDAGAQRNGDTRRHRDNEGVPCALAIDATRLVRHESKRARVARADSRTGRVRPRGPRPVVSSRAPRPPPRSSGLEQLPAFLVVPAPDSDPPSWQTPSCSSSASRCSSKGLTWPGVVNSWFSARCVRGAALHFLVSLVPQPRDDLPGNVTITRDDTDTSDRRSRPALNAAERRRWVRIRPVETARTTRSPCPSPFTASIPSPA